MGVPIASCVASVSNSTSISPAVRRSGLHKSRGGPGPGLGLGNGLIVGSAFVY
jgi:hypothetical protein